MSKNLRSRLLLITLLLSPGLWLLIVNSNDAIKSVTKWPGNTTINVKNVFSAENHQKINLLRDTSNPNILDKVFYNKFTLITDGVFEVVSTISPRYFFAPIIRVEVIPFLSLPLVVIWLVDNLRRKTWWKFLLSFLITAILLFLTRPDNFFIYALIGLAISYRSVKLVLEKKINLRLLIVLFSVLICYQVLLIYFVLI